MPKTPEPSPSFASSVTVGFTYQPLTGGGDSCAVVMGAAVSPGSSIRWIPRPNVIAYSVDVALWIFRSCTDVFGRFVPSFDHVVDAGSDGGWRRKKTPRSPDTITALSTLSITT